MADIKITDLAAYTDPVSTDVLPIVDVGSDLTKKVSIADLLENAGTGNVTAPSFSFDGDNDTGIYQPGLDQIAISTGGIQRLQVDSSGNMLLGGTLPSTSNITLNADGSANFNNYVQAKAGFRAKQDTGYYFIGQSTSNVNTFLVESAGNVKIGGTLPSSPNITLNADGSAGYAGAITHGGWTDNSDVQTRINPGSIFVKGPNNINPFLSYLADGYDSADSTLTLHRDGSAFFASDVQVGGDPKNSSGVELGTVIRPSGEIITALANDTDNALSIKKVGNTNPRVLITTSGDVKIGGTLPSTPNITLKANGTGTFTGNVKSLGLLTSSDTAVNDRVQFGYMATPTGHNLGHRIVGDGQDLYYFSRENGTSGHKFYVHGSGGSSHLMEINGTPANEKVMIGGTLPSAPNITLNADGSASFSNGDVNIDSSGRLLVGTSSGFNFTTNSGAGISRQQLVGVGTDETASFAITHCNQGGTSRGPSLVLAKNRSGSTVLGTVQVGENLGEISFQGSTSSGFVRSAGIRCEQDGGTPSSTSMAGRLIFSTTADGASSPNKRMQIDSSGDLLIGGSLPLAPNISLNADGSAQFSGSVSIGGTAAANTIDEYEEGTWTPTMTEFGGSSIPFTITNAAYVRVGEVVTIQALLVLTAASNGQVLNPVIAGLPYTQKGRSNCQITTTNSTVNSQGYSSSGPVFVARSNSSIQCGPTDAEQLVITSTYIIA